MSAKHEYMDEVEELPGITTDHNLAPDQLLEEAKQSISGYHYYSNEHSWDQLLKTYQKDLFGDEPDINSNQKFNETYFEGLGDQVCIESSPKHQSESYVQTVSPMIVQKKGRGRPPIADKEEKMRRKKDNQKRASKKYRIKKIDRNEKLEEQMNQLIEKQKQLKDLEQSLQSKHKLLRSLCLKFKDKLSITHRQKFLRIIKKYPHE